MRLSTDQVDEPAQPVLLVEELQHGSEREGNGEEHGGVAHAGSVGRLQQPHCVGHHVGKDAVWEHTHLHTHTHTHTHTHSRDTEQESEAQSVT